MSGHSRHLKSLLAIMAAIILAACAPLRVAEPPTVETACERQFERWDDRVRQAGVQDAGAARVDGFPYLRVNRFLASFRHELDGDEQTRVWLEAMRDLDRTSRRIELQNLGVENLPEQLTVLDACGRQMVDELVADKAAMARLRHRAYMPDDYSMPARILGLYPLAVPFLKWGIAGYHDKVREMYRMPLASGAGAELKWYAPPMMPGHADHAAAWVVEAQRDDLGRQQLNGNQAQALLAAHAPTWWVEEMSTEDRPGRPVWAGGELVVSQQTPVVYHRLAHTRFQDEVLLQLVYMLWFPARPHESVLDAYAGRYDAVVWRVTLGPDGQPLLYDSIHACGCYHYFFAARPLALKPQRDWWQEPVLYPQTDPGAPSRPPLVLRLQARTHYLKRVLPENAVSIRGPVTYHMAPYDNLRSLPDGRGGYRSMFNAGDGLVQGSERLERFWLWPSGVNSPGAMRQWGRHATAFVGQRHFDDPRLLESLIQAISD